jgi:hypothetical protein
VSQPRRQRHVVAPRGRGDDVERGAHHLGGVHEVRVASSLRRELAHARVIAPARSASRAIASTVWSSSAASSARR